MTTANNEACLGWLDKELLFGEGYFSGMGNEHFYATGLDSHPIYWVSSKGLVEWAGQSIHCGGNNQNERRGYIFNIIGDTGDIIPRDNSARNCYVLRVLIQINVFK